MEEDEDTISELMYTLDGINMLILRRDFRQKNSASFANKMALSWEMGSLRDESKKMTDELEVVHQTCAKMDYTISIQEDTITKMKHENQALKAEYVNLNGEMASVLYESEKKTGQITKLINAQQALQQRLEEKYRVSLDKQSQDIHEKTMIIEDLVSFCCNKHIITIQELRTNSKHLEVELEKARMFGGPNVNQAKKEDLGWLPHSHVEVEKDQAPELLDVIEEKKGPVVDGQTKSWWRRQVRKMVMGMGTFRLRLKRCLGVKRSKKPVARLIEVKPVNSTVTTMDIGMPPVSV